MNLIRIVHKKRKVAVHKAIQKWSILDKVVMSKKVWIILISISNEAREGIIKHGECSEK
jgi:hypothetical protein